MCQRNEHARDLEDSRLVRFLAARWFPLAIAGSLIANALFYGYLAVLARWVIRG